MRERQFLELSSQVTEEEFHSIEISSQLKDNNIKLDKEKNQDSASAMTKENPKGGEENLEEEKQNHQDNKEKEHDTESNAMTDDENERLLQKRNAYYVNRSYSIA